jgi:hypothetical protein
MPLWFSWKTNIPDFAALVRPSTALRAYAAIHPPAPAYGRYVRGLGGMFVRA